MGIERRMPYVQFLDGLRCVAVSWVFLFHMQLYFKLHASGAFGLVASRGWMGVDLFFVISGFLITSILLREHESTGRISLPKFYLRRALRIWPVYYLMVAAMLVFALLTRNEKILSTIKWPAMYLTDVYAAYGSNEVHVLLHSWSLAVEEQFYLLWPLLLFWNVRRAKYIAIAAVFGIALWRTWLAFHLPVGIVAVRRTYYAPDTRMDQIMYGALLAYLVIGQRDLLERFVRTKAVQIAAIALLLAAIYVNVRWSGRIGNAIGYSMSGLSMAVGVAYLLIVRPLRVLSFLESKPAVYVGKVSYGIYLFSPFVIGLVKDVFPRHNVAETLAACVAAYLGAILMASISYTFLESPFLKLKDRINSSLSSLPPNKELRLRRA